MEFQWWNFSDPELVKQLIFTADVAYCEQLINEEGKPIESSQDTVQSISSSPGMDCSCQGCHLSEFEIISKFYKQEKASRDFLQRHRVYPSRKYITMCRECREQFVDFQSAKNGWVCTREVKWIRKAKLGKRNRILQRCNSTRTPIYQSTGTILDRTRVPWWKVLLLASSWVRKDYKDSKMEKNLKMDSKTIHHFKKKFNEACYSSYLDQEPIGGVRKDGSPIIVECDETLFYKAKYLKGSKRKKKKTTMSAVWIMGFVERHNPLKRVFYPLLKDHYNYEGILRWQESLQRDSATLIPIIEKYVVKGSLICTDGWTSYICLPAYGYHHGVCNHSIHEWVNPIKPHHHIQSIERVWSDLKEYSQRRGNRRKHLKYYIGRYLWLTQRDEDSRFHDFVSLLAEYYKHPLLAD